PDLANVPIVREVKTLLAEGFDERPTDDLAKLLGHRDARVRQGAQFALADKGSAAIATLNEVERGNQRLARLHAIWGLGQVGRKDRKALDALHELLTDRDDEVRAQSARVLGDARDLECRTTYISLLKDASPRVRFYAAMALGKLGRRDSTGP